MGVSRRGLLAATIILTFCLTPAYASGREGVSGEPENEARVFTDGHLRPGHLETIRVKGFPGKGKAEAIFFPTAICDKGCGAIGWRGGDTDAHGSGKLRVRVPGTFLAHDGKHVYFRDGERINLEVLWYGPHHAFDVADANPEPILLRTHGHRHG